MSEIHQLSATELAAAIARGEVSSRAALDHFLARIEAIGKPINAVVAMDIDAARARADAADAVVFDASSVSVSCRLGELEKLERSESNDLGLRVFVGKQQAVVSSTDFEPDTLWDVVERAVAMAKAVPEDPYCGLAETEQLVTDPPTLEICDTQEPSSDVLIDAARKAESAANDGGGRAARVDVLVEGEQPADEAGVWVGDATHRLDQVEGLVVPR